MIIYFVRHGMTRFNEMGLTQGVCDSPLSEKGKQQVAKTKELLKDITFDMVYTSPSGRAMETAAGISSVPFHLDARLKEVDFGAFEGSPTSLRDQLKLDHYCAWDYRLYGGNCINDVMEAHREFVNELYQKHPKATVLVTGHGCALTAFCRTYFHVPIDFFDNAQAVRIDMCAELKKVG